MFVGLFLVWKLEFIVPVHIRCLRNSQRIRWKQNPLMQYYPLSSITCTFNFLWWWNERVRTLCYLGGRQNNILNSLVLTDHSFLLTRRSTSIVSLLHSRSLFQEVHYLWNFKFLLWVTILRYLRLVKVIIDWPYFWIF